MGLKRIILLSEGPLDFVRGAVRQVAPAVRNVAQAGRQTSAVADLTKAVTTLVQLMQSAAQQKANTPTPVPRYQQPGTQARPASTTTQMSTRPQMTLSSYLQDVEGGRLDEGVWDAIKSGASAVARGIGGAVRSVVDPDGPAVKAFRDRFAHDTWLSDAAKAASKNTRPTTTTQQAVQQIQKILQRTQNPQQALKKVLSQVAGNGATANQIYAMIFPSTRPVQPPPQQQQRVRYAATQQQGMQPATHLQPARTFGPGQRRPRPPGGQP